MQSGSRSSSNCSRSSSSSSSSSRSLLCEQVRARILRWNKCGLWHWSRAALQTLLTTIHVSAWILPGAPQWSSSSNLCQNVYQQRCRRHHHHHESSSRHPTVQATEEHHVWNLVLIRQELQDAETARHQGAPRGRCPSRTGGSLTTVLDSWIPRQIPRQIAHRLEWFTTTPVKSLLGRTSTGL